MAKQVLMMVTYDTDSEKFLVDKDTTEAYFPESLCWDDEKEQWVDEPRLVEDVMQRLAVQLSSPPPLTAAGAREPVAMSTKFMELALNILDPDSEWDAEDTLEVCDAAGEFLREHPITDWEIEGAFALAMQFAHDWANGESRDSVLDIEQAFVFSPSTSHDLDVLDVAVDLGPVFE
jgi:hypothetical protein